MAIQFTIQQQQAISILDKNLIVVAGAGSGKTRVLVERFIALLDVHPDWPLTALVAITFTEKAAREMRDRVRQAVEARAMIAGPDQVRWVASRAALDSARIGTIHSLCTSILRANAAEAGIDPGFEVLDEVEGAILLEEAISDTLAALVREDHPAAALISDYGENAMRSVLSANTTREIAWLDSPAAYLERWEAANREAIAQAIHRLRSDPAFRAAMAWTPIDGWPKTTDRLMELWYTTFDYRDRFDSTADPVETADLIRHWAGEYKLSSGYKAWGSKESAEEAKDQIKAIRDRLGECVKEMGPEFDREIHAQMAQYLSLWRDALDRTKAHYRELKEANSVLDFDDLEQYTCRLLREFPQVAARYRGGEFRHLMVDEFQDTNQAQYEIVTALAGTDNPGALFLVGDPKQSIYLFRGAEVSVFEQVRAGFASAIGQEIPLSTSFRTHERLVSMFNHLFKAVFAVNGERQPYEVDLGEPMQAIRPTESDLPAVEIMIIENGDMTVDEAREAEGIRLAARIRQLVAEGMQIWDRASGQIRPMDYGDIAVLFQARAGMPFIEEAFKAENIPYVTIGGIGYYDLPEVNDLLNLLRALYNPGDDLSLAVALRSPLYNLSDDDLLALRLQRDSDGKPISLWQAILRAPEDCNPAIPDSERVTFARSSLVRLAAMAGRITIAELLTLALEETGYPAALVGLRNGERRVENVEKLLEIARRSGRISLGAFTAYLQNMADRETRESEALVDTEGAVQLMTVHASKGLEFPVVCIFDASRGERAVSPLFHGNSDFGPVCKLPGDGLPGSAPEVEIVEQARSALLRRESAEKRRLLYVAMTRAQDRVILSGRSKTDGKSWLDQVLAALGAGDPNKLRVGDFQIGPDCLIRVMPPPPEDRPIVATTTEKNGWEALTDGTIEPILPGEAPPLMAPIPVDPIAPARVLAATDIARLGEGQAAPDPGLFRRTILGSAPHVIREVGTPDARLSIPQRTIGEIVHRALRWWRLPRNTDADQLDRILNSYAWDAGLSEPGMIRDAVGQARELLMRSELALIADQIEAAAERHTELPFTIQIGDHTVSGVIDLLFRDRNDIWHVVDYKISFVPRPPRQAIESAVSDHARRYHAQVGVYAAAVEALIGQVPLVHIHYIRYVHTVDVPTPAWRNAVAVLGTDIRTAMEPDDEGTDQASSPQ